MRLFADRDRLVAPRLVAQALRDRVGDVNTLPAGPARHAALAALLAVLPRRVRGLRGGALAGEAGVGPEEAARRRREADRLADALRRVAAGAPLEGPGGDDPGADR